MHYCLELCTSSVNHNCKSISVLFGGDMVYDTRVLTYRYVVRTSVRICSLLPNLDALTAPQSDEMV